MNPIVQSETASQTILTPNSTKSKVYFFKYDMEVSEDIGLQKTTCALYTKLLGRTNIRTRTVRIYINELAKLLNCSKWTVRRHLRKLIDMGLVDRILSKSRNNPKMNIASLFIVHGADALRYKGSQDTEAEQPDDETRAKMCGGTHKIALQKTESIYLESESKGTNLTGKPELPISSFSEISSAGEEKNTQSEGQETFPPKSRQEQEESTKSNPLHQPEVSAVETTGPRQAQEERHSAKGLELDFTGIPDILIPTARSLMTLSGRTKLEDYEIICLKKLLEKHTPTRIQREIEKRAADFKKRGRNPKCLKANYLYKILMGQPATYNPNTARAKKKATRRNNTATKSTAPTESTLVADAENMSINTGEYVSNAPKTTESAASLSMSVADAERVIAEHQSAKKPEAEKPVELTGLYEQIKAAEASGEKLTELQYFGLLYPEYSEEQLREVYNQGSPQSRIWLREAMYTDRCCAHCTDPTKCRQPRIKSQEAPRRNVTIGERYGNKALLVTEGEVIPCRHISTQSQTECEFEHQVKESGLIPKQATQTFDSYDHKNAGAEGTVAKAQAMLASERKTNLVLAGRSGTGKTHLATAIALEAIRAGQKVIFDSVPELLSKLAEAARNFQDISPMKRKYKEASLLVLDDLGKETTSQTRLSYLFEILDYRYKHGLQTIVTTNAYELNGLINKWNIDYMEPIVSRLLENGNWVTIRNAENYRLKRHSGPSNGIEMHVPKLDDGLDDDEDDLRLYGGLYSK